MTAPDYIVTAARAGQTYYRQRYKERSKAVKCFERLLGKHIETLGHDRNTVKLASAPADGGHTVTFRERA